MPPRKRKSSKKQKNPPAPSQFTQIVNEFTSDPNQFTKIVN
jgi:hypothetical protein